MDPKRTFAHVERVWDETIVPSLVDYIRIPNKSPHFDAQWAEHGYMDQAVDLIAGWCRERPIEGLTLEVVRLEGRTPLLYMEIPGDSERTVLLYGHLDKQPEMTGWREGLGPWEPVIDGDKLYGRGGADDGYAAFASLTALEVLRDQGVPHARCVVLIEGCEESGSYDLPAYIDHLKQRIGTPDLVVCLDSGAGDYERLWLTTSLRGFVMGELDVSTVSEGVHSGDASGIVPSSFRVARKLLDRIEDVDTGEVLLDALKVEIPEDRKRQAAQAAEVLGDSVYTKFPFRDGARPTTTDRTQLVLNRTWRPALSIVGAAGLPAPQDAGNVLRPNTLLKVSIRIPPTADPEAALAAVEQTLTADAPYGAQVTFAGGEGAPGWAAPPLASWLEEAIDEASRAYFDGNAAVKMGEGGTIPFMGMLGEKFPKAQFVITGVLGPASNAHGPNEFLHIPTGKRLTACVAQVIARHHEVTSE
ncbi:MAG: M20 family metallopeptidase [Planctomycetota bacterium]|nr:M20 family metallopeptidase [Planctomycetota bacterium]